MRIKLTLEGYDIQAEDGAILVLETPVRFIVKDGQLTNLDPLTLEAQAPFLLVPAHGQAEDWGHDDCSVCDEARQR